ncbi:MAG: hypothetical protein LIO90_10755 [Bacteroidales bacterium]|nr:hypothetical protein [Bacteroidales bacterium]
MRATRSHTRFTELSAEYQGVMPITVALAGDFSFAAATVDVASTLKVKRGDVELPVTLHNRCSQPITDIDYAYTIGGVSGSQHLELPSPLPTHYDYPFAAVLPLGEVDEVGSYPLTLNITRVNGVRNTADGSYEGNIDVRYFVAKKRPLLEEFTGTWCTFCPRGYVGLEKMAEFYPDDFIAIAYHVDDPMVMKNGLPYTPGGYPLAKMDRVEWMDPYFGNNQEEVDFGIESTWLSYCNKGADMDLEVDAEWTAEGYIHITSTVTWAITPEADKNYRINYVLVADGLTGTELGWYQKNYYSHQATTPLYMDLFVEGDSYVGGLTFNHVGVYCASNSGLTPAIQGSTMEANVAFTHEYTLNPARAVDTNNESLIQDMNQLRVVAMWLDEETGEVLNAAKVEVPAFSTAINKVKGDATVESVVFYNLQGIPVATPAGGIFIRSERMTDGSLRNQKISIR